MVSDDFSYVAQFCFILFSYEDKQGLVLVLKKKKSYCVLRGKYIPSMFTVIIDILLLGFFVNFLDSICSPVCFYLLFHIFYVLFNFNFLKILKAEIL